MKNLVKYVNPNIGTVGHLLTATSPTVYYPHGIMQISPNFTPGINDRYLADKIYSFPVGPISVIACRQNNYENFEPKNFASSFDHDLESACPHMYSVFLETPKIQTVYSVTKHSAIFEFDFFDAGGDIILSMNEADTKIEDDIIFTKGKYFAVDTYAVCMFSKKPGDIKILNKFKNRNGTTTSIYKFGFKGGKVQMKAGISFIDSQQALYNLNHEIPGFDIEKIINTGVNVWNKELNKIVVSGLEKDKRIFYTAMYRALARPYNLSEYGRYYSNYDKKIHDDDGHEFYCGDGLWDTFRCMHPLQLILDPKVHEDILASYIRMYEQSGVMPNFPYPAKDNAFMIGFHSASLFADAYAKQIDFDIEKAYEGVRKNVFERSMLPWVDAPSTELEQVYYSEGFFPALAPGQKEWVPEVHDFEGRQAVSVTLEHSYTDWCAYILAKALGKDDDAEILLKRSKNYQNVFNKSTKFMSPKTADGEFIKDFNPKLSGGQGGRLYFSENNSWTYTFSVFHDIAGLIELFGGKEEFAKRLDDLFVENLGTSKYDFLKWFPDSTGLIGQYSMGNEPSFHIPYLYNYVGESHKTQRKIHEIINMWFHDHPLGICGDEDGGAMSAWLVFSAIGIYPVCPGKPEYDIGSPLFDEIIINTKEAKLKIIADGASDKRKYINSMDLSTRILETPVLKHEDLYKDTVLKLEMTKLPKIQ